MDLFSIFLAVVCCFGVFFIYKIYRQLAQLRSLFSRSFMQMNQQLKKRYDLVSDIVETAKTYMKEDREMLESVINARNTALQADKEAASNPANPKTMECLIEAEAQLNASLRKLLRAFDGYPELKKDTNVQQLMTELTMAEDEISSAQKDYNEEVTKYNFVRNKGLPTSTLARIFAFWPGSFFGDKKQQKNKRPPPIA